MERIRAVKTTRWVRFGIVAALFMAWVAWLGNWWVALWLILLFDIYITGYIPFTWWKKSKNSAVRAIMSWVDAIVYALILVYFVFTYVGQNYQIPSSSLEKTLLTGDYLWVNKMSYGPRVPMTPIHFPLVQNTLPVLETKSYLEWPQWTYHRLKGLGNVELGDIVVFNFPAGDTVALKIQNPDYYTLVKTVGRDRILAHPETFGEVIYRPVDRRENYVKRAVGLPGQTLRIVDGNIEVDGKQQTMPANAQFNYFFQVDGWNNMTAARQTQFWDDLGVAVDDRGRASNDPNVLYAPLTQDMITMLQANPAVSWIERIATEPDPLLYPHDKARDWGWTVDNYGPVVIPSKGMTIELNDSTWALYGRCVRNYEHNDAELRQDGRVYIDGQPCDSYTFMMDYYFMMGDNRHNSLDSRFWGFVPEDHIVGKPMMVLVSFDKDRGLLNGGIRWNRILRTPNPDK
ncbi:MAG: signal peptidase I [Muribaculaceae bacterium]|nr:signal peptidase I [Muribaculaceae bacterium]